MDIGNLIGMILGIGLICFGIVDGGKFDWFLDPASFAITGGGTIASLLMSYPLSSLKRIPKHFKIIMFPPKYNPYEYIDKISELAKEARKKGLLALEDKANESADPFLSSAVMMIVDAMDPAKVKQLLESELDNLEDRHGSDRGIYETGAALAPAYGMLGTLIGLINMLNSMATNPDGLAGGMAIALITTFYGSFLANFIFMPIGNKLKARHNEEMLCKLIVAEGIIAIQAGENPRHIEDKLLNFLPQKMRDNYRAQNGEGASSEEGGKKK